MTNSNTASAALPENFTLIDLAKSGGWKAFASTGIACPLAWGFIINAIGATEPTGQIPWTVSYLVLAVAVIAFAAISRSIPAFFTSQSMELIAAVLGAASTVFMVLSFTVFDSVSIQYLTTILCACVLGWLYLQWGTFYAQLGLRSTVCYLFLANIGGSTIKAFSHFIPIWGQCLLGMALPVLSVVMCKIAIENARKGANPTMRFESHNMRGLWKAAVAIAAFSFVVAFLVGQFLGNQNSIPVADFLMSRLFEIAISAIVLFITVGLNKPFNFSQLWRIALLVLGLDLLTQAAFPEITILRCVESSAWDLIVLFAWLTLSDIAHHSKLSAPWVFGIGWACYTAPFAIGSIAASAYPAGAIDAPVIFALMFVLVLLSTFCLELRDQDTKWLFAELRGEPVSEPSDFRSIDERCEEVGKQHGLTPRELEIMQLLCKGRTKAYIAETLYLTENTVKGHTKHIYSKLDVHSKQELMDMVEKSAN